MSATMTQAPVARQSWPVSDMPDPEVPERARRRTYTAKYKHDVLAEYEACDRAGRGALLRREGLYTSLISAWRDQRDRGALEALARPAGAQPAGPAERENTRLRRENQRLAAELGKARAVIDPRDRQQHERVRAVINDAITELTPIIGARQVDGS